MLNQRHQVPFQGFLFIWFGMELGMCMSNTLSPGDANDTGPVTNITHSHNHLQFSFTLFGCVYGVSLACPNSFTFFALFALIFLKQKLRWLISHISYFLKESVAPQISQHPTNSDMLCFQSIQNISNFPCDLLFDPWAICTMARKYTLYYFHWCQLHQPYQQMWMAKKH